MDFIDTLREKAFIGREFLTWLWFKSESTGGRVTLANGNSIEVLFLDRMTLSLPDATTPQTVTLKGEQSELREGLAALREGKKIEEARIAFKMGENDFTTVIKATWFSFGSFRTPPVLPTGEAEQDEGPDGAFLEKVWLVEEGLSLIDKLFSQFLALRVSDKWGRDELPAFLKWAREQ